MHLVDTHIHLTDKRFSIDLDQILERSREAGIERWVTIGTSIDNGKEARTLAEKTNDVYFAAAIHPHDAKSWNDETVYQLKELLRGDKVVGLGEIGLDYHYDFAPRDTQIKVFEEQIELAIELDLPIIIHCREAFDDVIKIIKEHSDPKLHGVFHCFSEGPAEAEQVVDIGFMLGLGGVITFKRSEEIREAAKIVPLDCIVTETDAPYLSPEPFRGKRNEPAYISHIIKMIAEVRGIDIDEAIVATTANAAQLFRQHALENS